jgi:amino acid transporter
MTSDTPSSKFGLFSMVMLGVNGVIGSGIFLLPSIPMALMGPSSIFIFPLVSLVAMTIALCFAECAGRFQRNGAAYLYAREAFGEFVGFEVGLLKLSVNIAAWAAFAVGFISALGQLVPLVLEEPWHSLAVTGFLVLLTISQLLGVHFIKILNNIMTIGKLVPLAIFIAIGIFYLNDNHFTHLIPPKFEIGNVGSAALIIFFAFSGFESIALAAEDMKNPAKNLPRAILLVLAICSIIYLLLQVIAVGILGPALSFSKTPLYDAAVVIGPWTGDLMAVGTLVSIGGVALAASYITPRTAIALAQDKLLPQKIAEVNSRKVPVNAIILCGAITIAIALTGSFTKLATISVVARLVQFLPTALAVLVFRRRYEEKSAYQIPFGPLVPCLAIIFTLWLVSNASFQELFWGMGALLFGIPLYWSMKYRKKAPVFLKYD